MPAAYMANVCFSDEFAKLTLSCWADSEARLSQQVQSLIQECSIPPTRAHALRGGKTEFVVMACWDNGNLDADLTRRIQFDVYDWMMESGDVYKLWKPMPGDLWK